MVVSKINLWQSIVQQKYRSESDTNLQFIVKDWDMTRKYKTLSIVSMLDDSATAQPLSC